MVKNNNEWERRVNRIFMETLQGREALLTSKGKGIIVGWNKAIGFIDPTISELKVRIGNRVYIVDIDKVVGISEKKLKKVM